MGRKDTAAVAMTALTTTAAMIAKSPTSQRRPQAMRSIVSEPADESCVCVFVANFFFSLIKPAQKRARLYLSTVTSLQEVDIPYNRVKISTK
jgi:hypothetical protein